MRQDRTLGVFAAMETPIPEPVNPPPNRSRSRLGQRKKWFISRRSCAKTELGTIQLSDMATNPTGVTLVSFRQLSRKEIIFCTVAVLIILSSFVASFFWHRLQLRRLAAASDISPSTEEQRASALRSLDEAVRARYEERMDEAMAQLAMAQQTDPQLPGLELLAGEIAIEKRDTEALRHASANALQRKDNKASAKLLAALEVWQRRDGLGMEQAGPQAKQLLLDAAESEPSHVAAHFFYGEISRQLGDSTAAHAHLLLALRRLVAWQSSALLQVKMQLAAAEALEAGEVVEVSAPDAQSAVALRWQEAVRRGTDASEELKAMIALAPSLQTIVLLPDPALKFGDDASADRALRRELGSSVLPRGSVSISNP
jgi:hypothetical protein